MICDYLRSCYSTHVRLHKDQPNRFTLIRWYWAPEGAKELPHRSAIMSLNWESRNHAIEEPAIGEMPGFFRTWNNGAPPANLAVTGQDFCGEPEWFVEGNPDGLVVPRSPDGPALACAAPVPDGMWMDGDAFLAVLPPPAPVAMCNATNPAPASFTAEISISGVDPLLMELNGPLVFTVREVSGPNVSYSAWKALSNGRFALLGVTFQCSGTWFPLHSWPPGYDANLAQQAWIHPNEICVDAASPNPPPGEWNVFAFPKITIPWAPFFP